MAAKKREAVKPVPMKPVLRWGVVDERGVLLLDFTTKKEAAKEILFDERVARVEIREVEPKRRRK